MRFTIGDCCMRKHNLETTSGKTPDFIPDYALKKQNRIIMELCAEMNKMMEDLRNWID